MPRSARISGRALSSATATTASSASSGAAISRSGSSRSGCASSPAASPLSASASSGQVGGAAPQRLEHLARGAVAQRDPHARVGGVEGGELGRQPQQLAGRGREPHEAAGDAGVLVHRRAGAADVGEDRLRAGEQLLPGGRDLDAGAGALEQLQPELALEPAHLLRERGLGDVELLGRAREVAMARDRREVLELPQVHACGR